MLVVLWCHGTGVGNSVVNFFTGEWVIRQPLLHSPFPSLLSLNFPLLPHLVPPPPLMSVSPSLSHSPPSLGYLKFIVLLWSVNVDGRLQCLL